MPIFGRRSVARTRTFTVVRVEIHPLTADDVPAAGRMLADRHRRHRATQPLLSPRFEDPDTASRCGWRAAAFGVAR